MWLCLSGVSYLTLYNVVRAQKEIMRLQGFGVSNTCSNTSLKSSTKIISDISPQQKPYASHITKPK